MTDRVDGESPPPPSPYVGLLTELMTHTLDQDYRTVASRRSAEGDRKGSDPRSGLSKHVGAIAAVIAFGVLVGVSALKTAQDRPQALAERTELVQQIQARQGRLDAQHAALASVETSIGRLQQQLAVAANADSRLSVELRTLAVNAGTMSVTGPGMLITLDDAPHGLPGVGGVILDRDLQALVNGLWAAGAEAISIDGHRLTALTAIRFAGQAITVDYRSLAPPYVVEAIGDPDTLPARLLETAGGQYWAGLRSNFGVTFDTQTVDHLELAGDPHDHLLWARPGGGR